MNDGAAGRERTDRWWCCGACLSAALLAAATTIEDLWLLSGAYLVPWLWAIRRSSSAGSSFLNGLTFGLFFGLVRLDWIRCTGCRSIWEVGPFWEGWLAASALVGLAYAAGSVALWHTMTVRNYPATAVLPLCLLSVEYGIDWFTRSVAGTTGDLARLALTGTSVPYLMLVTANCGVPGMSAAIACLNGIAFDATSRVSAKSGNLLLISLASATAGLGFAIWQPAAYPPIPNGESFDVIVVSDDPFERHPSRVEAILATKSVRPPLLVWPEMGHAEPMSEDTCQFLRTTAAELGCHILIGAPRYSLDSPNLFNSAILIDSRGLWCGAYDKTWLGPGVESPFPFCHWFPGGCPTLMTQFSSGSSQRALSIPGGPTFGVGICHDVCFPEWLPSVESKNEPCHFLVTIANEQFEPSRRATELLLRLTKLRAVEAGIPIVRCVRGGTSGLIHPDGRMMNAGAIGENDPPLTRISVPLIRPRMESNASSACLRVAAWMFVWLPLLIALIAQWSGLAELRHAHN